MLTPEQKRDRQMIELLNELRVALPGVQVLFGFLLMVPFADGFERVTAFQRDVYFVTVLLAGAATVFLIAPSAAHRVRFHRGDRTWLVENAHLMLMWGLGALGLAIVGAILLVTDYLYDGVLVYVMPPLMGLLVVSLWIGRPLRRHGSEAGPRA